MICEPLIISQLKRFGAAAILIMIFDKEISPTISAHFRPFQDAWLMNHQKMLIGMFSKYVVFTFFGLFTMAALTVLILSIGWYLPIFSVILIPTFIMQALAGLKAYKKQPEFNGWLMLSGMALLLFTLFRPDTDAHGSFSGYTSLMYHLGVLETKHSEPWAYSLELALIFLLSQIFINTLILLRKPKRAVV